MEISVLKQLETGSSSSGNKSLCFGTVSLRHRGGYWPGTTTNGWKLPGEHYPPTHRQSPPPSLPNVSHELKPAKARCSGFLTSGWKNLPFALTEKKTIWPYSYHFVHIIKRFISLYAFVLHKTMWKQYCIEVLHHQNICISLLSTYSNRGCSRLERIRWLESLIYRSRTNMHTCSQ